MNGKSFTVLQIIWRLAKVGVRKRIRFLAGRSLIADQTARNDLDQFGPVLAKNTNRHYHVNQNADLVNVNSRCSVRMRDDTLLKSTVGQYFSSQHGFPDATDLPGR